MLQNDPASLPDIFEIIARWWKKIMVIILIALVCVTIILLIKPRQYLAVATALPASNYAADKAGIFNNNIQLLYPGLGTADELDKIIGTAQLDTVYKLLVDSFDLINDYTISGRHARQKATEKIKENTSVLKSDYGELKIKIWHTHPQKAANLANALMQILQQMHQQIQNVNNTSLLQKLKETRQQKLAQLNSMGQKMQANRAGNLLDAGNKLVTRDSIIPESLSRPGLEGQILQYEKLIYEYELLINSNPKVLVVVENASAPSKADRPKVFTWLVITLFAGFIFAVLTVVVLEKNRKV